MHDLDPCPLCGYAMADGSCTACGGRTTERSLARPLVGPWSGIRDGLEAMPRGLAYLVRTRGVKRWLVPPLVLTLATFVLVLYGVHSVVDGFVDAHLSGGVELDRDAPWGWLEGLTERWGWLAAVWGALVAAAEWVLNALLAFLTSAPLRLLAWFLIGSLVAWYAFSIAYEAIAGPFLDEVQARFEARWFGADPRSLLERPTDIPTASCERLTILSSVLASVLVLGAALLTPLSVGWALLLAPLGFVPALVRDPRYGTWCLWVARIEARALWVGIQASLVTGLLLLLAVPLYFVPGVGYFLFAGVTGFATAIGLLDIPFERRGWRLRARISFVGRNLPALLVFGMSAGLLLAVPVLGPLLMVPSASIGGLWLVCRLDKSRRRRPRDVPLRSGPA